MARARICQFDAAISTGNSMLRCALFCALLRSAMPKGTNASAEYCEVASRLMGQGVPMTKVRRITGIVHNAGAETRHEIRQSNNRIAHHLVDHAGIITSRKLALGDGSEMFLDFVEPAASLGLVLHHNAGIRQVFQETLRRFPCGSTRPWRTVWGMDECCSGNILAATGRKAMALSYTFQEFGKTYRSRDAFWFAVAVAEKLRGGWSDACRMILETFFLDRFNGMARHGMLVSFQDQHVLMHAII